VAGERGACAACRKVPAEPVVSPWAASQDLAFGVVNRAHGEGGASSSGEKHTPIVAPDVTEAAGSGEGVAKASGIA